MLAIDGLTVPSLLIIVAGIGVFLILLLVVLLVAVRQQRVRQQDQQAQETQQQALLTDLQQTVLMTHQDVKQLYNQMQSQQQAQLQQFHLFSNQLVELKSGHQAQLMQHKHDIFKLLAELKQMLDSQLSEHQLLIERSSNELKSSLTALLAEHKTQFNHNQLAALTQLTEHLSQTTRQNREELSQSLHKSAETLSLRMTELTRSTEQQLKAIAGQVEKRLADGFDKTTQTFNDIVKRLALIDKAQQTITALSSDVVSLQEVLADKRSRGAFGEVQLSSLIRNMLAPSQFAFQHTLSNGKIADCVVFLPPPTGNVVIDSKFPLENFRRMMDNSAAKSDRELAERQFKQDVRKHINDIADKYLIANETGDGALMFIPAEAVFAQIHAHYPDVLELAYQRRIWLTSPTTLMAILTTARSVIKDEATRQQVHIIQDHLVKLGGDFGRFRHRFDNLAKHIDQVAGDVRQIHTSAEKITLRFDQIEKVDVVEGLEERIEDRG